MPARAVLRVATVACSVLALAWANGSAASAGSIPDPSRFRVTAIAQVGPTIVGAKTGSGELAQSDPGLLARADTSPVDVLVKLDLDGAASYPGGIAGLAATSPSKTHRKLKQSDRAVAAYLSYAGGVTQKAAAAITAKVPAARVQTAFTVAYGGLSVRLPANQAKTLLSVPGVVAVQSDTLEQVQTDATPQYIGATAVWPSLGGSTKAGQGVIVGVIDSGIRPEHPSLADNGIDRPAGGPWACELGDGTDPALGPAFTCNDKLVGAYAFTQTNMANNPAGADEYCNPTTRLCSARDSDGHGTHTATTAAGSAVASAPLLGIDRGPISGIAPGASVIAYRVCLARGCYASDSVRAVAQAITDGVDVINFSVSGGKNPYTDPVDLAFLDAFSAGISVNTAAGNDGPNAGTTEHAAPWVTTVGASTSNRTFRSSLTLTADNGDHYTKVGTTLTAGVGAAPVVLAQAVPGYTGDAYCGAPFAEASLTGKVVVCQRGGPAGRVQKGYNALQGGAVGMVLYNPTLSDTETDNHWLPTIHLNGPNDDLVAFLTAHTGVTAAWATGQRASVRGDVMAGFSSRGPQSDWLKPDLTAPGVQILAGNTPTPTGLTSRPPGQPYQAIDGTSMASPHSAGASALVKAAHPTWTPAEVKSALMTSSAQDVLKEDGHTSSDPFDRGAGGLRVNTAVAAVVTLDETATRYAAAASNTLNPIDLNLPSIQANPLPGAVTTHRTLTNMTGKDQPFKVSATTTNGLKVTVSPSSFSVPAGGTSTIAVTLDGTRSGPGWGFGTIMLISTNAKIPRVVLPVAAQRGDAIVPMTHVCSPTTLPLDQNAHCRLTLTNQSEVPAPVTLSLAAGNRVDISSVSPPAAGGVHGFTWSGTLSPVTAPTIDSITPGGSPAGYVPLSLFGIAPVAGMGDETITNFAVPSFTYGGETYDTIGVDSNGYVVVGGGAAADNVCCNLKPIPDVARPNNVVAPYWTDLHLGIGTGAVRAGTLSDGVSSWIVVDYAEVSPSGAPDVKNSFEVWLKMGATEEVTLAYGDLGGPAAPGLRQGAENRTGTSGATLVGLSGTDWTVHTSPSTPGGSVTVTYDASGTRAGTYVLAPQATTPLVNGVISTPQTLTVG